MALSNILLEAGTNELEIVEFFIDEPGDYRGYYGINVSKVVEISRSQRITAMPEKHHPAILGAFPFRSGRIVPVIDVSKYLDKGEIQSDDPRIIITEFNKTQTAFLVSGVTRIHRISWKQVEAPSSFLIEMSRGSITAIVRLEERVVFLLDVEAIVATMNPAMSVKMDRSRPEIIQEQKFHIIHADDSISIRKLVYDELVREGRFEVTQVTDGEEAWNILRRYKKMAEEKNVKITDLIQGVISDIEMPNLDGLTLCKYIKEDKDLMSIPVAMFSSLITKEMERKCHSVGADAQFAKPELQAISDEMYKLISTKSNSAKT